MSTDQEWREVYDPQPSEPNLMLGDVDQWSAVDEVAEAVFWGVVLLGTAAFVTILHWALA